ncbi:MAG: hypothetical protein AUI60_01265 [Thaumarchaeota archaeon 13_1_40CM_2_39_4]|nr:MAG: hypothetical protein AUH71_05520 [Thaumarchaeota archaeon 13_1_40CM_4_48_7]OLC92692.1 MAG: hypothetical protein AUI92_04625 [Thaumarchaeota archaeon 13_1_40CM_3_38_6]OLD41565.1 MAG: hypothetical protein AUI60_01265 [Thaumarchaeota archaeon 13_1_40CM_2_39_4]
MNANNVQNNAASSNARLLVIILAVIVALLVDTAITRTAVFFSSDLLSSWRIIVFFIISGAYVAGQYLILRYLHLKSREIRAKQNLHLDAIYKSVTVTQYALIAILLFIILQMMINFFYSTVLLVMIATLSYSLSAVLLALLSQRFFSWFRSNRNSVVLSYGLSSALLTANIVITVVFSTVILQDKPETIMPRFAIQIPITEIGSGSFKGILNQAYLASSVASFIMLWVATALLLHHHSKKLGNIRFWIIVAVPLAYFLTQFLNLFVSVLDPLVGLDPVSISIILTLAFWFSKPAGGILFGIVFWQISKSIDNKIVKDYMIISAYALVLMFVSNQAVPIVASPTYPPFGFATISFMGLSSYLLLVGIYSSTISVSQDVKLRRSIQKFALSELKLLQSLSSAEWKERAEGQVRKIIKLNQDAMVKDTGIQSSLTEENVKKYVDEVLSEIRKKGD